MKKTKILKPVLILTACLAIAIVIFAYAYHIQETVGEGHTPYFLVSVVFIGLFVILLIKYSPLFMQREAQGKLEKAIKRNENNLIKKSMTLNLDDLGYLFKDKLEYKKVTDTIYWAFHKGFWIKSTSYIIQVLNNFELSLSEEENNDEVEEENDFTDMEIKALEEAMPRKANNAMICRIVINVIDNINDEHIKEAELAIKNYRVLAETAGAFMPSIIYFLYDKSTNTLYYEQSYKKKFLNTLNLRIVSMNRFYKTIGLIEK